MKYNVNTYNQLLIYNNDYKLIFINRNNYWVKREYNHKGREIYFEDNIGNKENYEI